MQENEVRKYLFYSQEESFRIFHLCSDVLLRFLNYPPGTYCYDEEEEHTGTKTGNKYS